MATDQEQEQASTQLTVAPPPAAPLQKVPVRLGIAPTSLEEGWRLAQMMANSELVPKNFRKHPEDVLVAIQMGVEIGLPPMQALQSIAVINGRPSVWGDGFLALIMASAAYADHDEYYEVDGERRDGLVADDFKKDSTAAVCTFSRRGKTTPITRRFTVGQARKASLLGKEGPWQSYPDRMLSMRARSWAGRDAFPDVLRGISTTEEIMDAPPEIESITVPPPSEVKRISDAPKTTPAAATPASNEVAFLGRVKNVEMKEDDGGGYYVVTLQDDKVFETNDTASALELEKFKGTSHDLKFVCARGSEQALDLVRFSIAD